MQSNLVLNKMKSITIKNISTRLVEANKLTKNSLSESSPAVQQNLNLSCLNKYQLNQQSVRFYSQQERKTFLGGFFEQLKEEYSKNKEMKDSIQKFREEAKKLEQSDALKEARKKYVNHFLLF
jgi:hypothetical protein